VGQAEAGREDDPSGPRREDEQRRSDEQAEPEVIEERGDRREVDERPAQRRREACERHDLLDGGAIEPALAAELEDGVGGVDGDDLDEESGGGHAGDRRARFAVPPDGVDGPALAERQEGTPQQEVS
jgi:hypothetical protein